MPVITIRGQEASGAPEIGIMVAKELQIDYVDSKIIADVAVRLNRNEIEVLKKETPPAQFSDVLQGRWRWVEGLFQRTMVQVTGRFFICANKEMYPWEIPIDDKLYLKTLRVVIIELAKNQAIVIRGRGSQFILKDFSGAFHVLVVAPLDLRVKRVMERMKLDRRES